jgi:glycosyltransferase involved in cell wall biosynthesis
MRVIVDGVVYGRQTYGGINTYFNEVLPRLATRHGAAVDVFMPNTLRGAPPRPPVRCHRRELIPWRTGLSWRMDERLRPLVEYVNLGLITLWGRTHARALYHSTYFTSPPVPLPHVAMVHDLNHELFPQAYTDEWGRWLRARYPAYLRGATRIIAVSNTTKAHAVDLYGISPSVIDVVHHAVDPGVFYVDQGEAGSATLRDRLGIRGPYLLYVGIRGSAYKNFGTLLHALARRPPAGLGLVVAGAPWSERERSELRRLALDSAVRLIEYPDDDTLRYLYSFASAFVYPSLNEGFGIPLLEAMACGTPVIAADIPVFREVAGDAAVYFDPRDPESLARAIDTGLDEATRREHIARGFQRLQSYSWDKTTADTYAVYQKALA